MERLDKFGKTEYKPVGEGRLPKFWVFLGTFWVTFSRLTTTVSNYNIRIISIFIIYLYSFLGFWVGLAPLEWDIIYFSYIAGGTQNSKKAVSK